MGWVVNSFKPLNRLPVSFAMAPNAVAGLSGRGFETYVREGYQKNEIVFAAIELLATSAAEPRIIGRRRSRAGTPPEEVTQHPLVQLLNQPNPLMSRFQLWATVIMDRYLAGNAYLLKARGEWGNNVVELWRVRPDRVKVVPAPDGFGIDGYQIELGGGQRVDVEQADIVHFKTRNPLDNYYGMPPLMSIAGRIDIDNYMKDFVKSFFQNAGVPAGILSVKQRLNQDAKDEIRNRFRRQFAGPSGWHELMVLDQAESTFTPTTMALGARGLVIPELNAIDESRIAMVFGVPASILGLLVGMESSSYANKRSDWQVLWDITLAPLYRDLADVLNLSLLPDFSGLDEVLFDLSDVRALQEDVDKMHDRWRKTLQAGGCTLEEFRVATGLQPEADGIYLIPGNYTPTKSEQLGEAVEAPEVAAAEALVNLIRGARQPAAIEAPTEDRRVVEARCPDCDKLGARDILEGEPVWCRKCKKEFAAGGVVIEGEVVKATRKRIERDAEGRITAIVEEQV